MKRDLLEEKLLYTLADGHTVSGAELATKLHVTRAAIWKRIKRLKDTGLPILAEAGKGYTLAWPIQLLDKQEIEKHIKNNESFSCDIYWQLDSTQNQMLRSLTELKDLAVIIAETQASGRARHRKVWLSPPGVNVYFSCLKYFFKGFTMTYGLPLVIGVCIVEALSELGCQDLAIKWPNHIVSAKGLKLGGVLIELSGEYDGPCAACIGVGINLRLTEQLDQGIAKQKTDLAQVMKEQLPNRNVILATLINHIRAGLIQFEKEGLVDFINRFNSYDTLLNKKIKILNSQEQIGVAKGVDSTGHLLIQTDEQLMSILNGDIIILE